MIQLSHGDNMINQENVEKLFDILDNSASRYYEIMKLPYLEGLVRTCENILSNTVEEENEE